MNIPEGMTFEELKATLRRLEKAGQLTVLKWPLHPKDTMHIQMLGTHGNAAPLKLTGFKS